MMTLTLFIARATTLRGVDRIYHRRDGWAAAVCYSQRILFELPTLTRAVDWWEAKLAPVFAFFYATAILLERPLLSLWWVPAIILLALVPGGAYVGVINDITDREEDLAAGKRNRTIGRSAWSLGLVVASCLAIGVAWLIAWRDEPLLFATYAAAWIVFSLYSIPPFRLKGRGIFGPLADAAGAHVLPLSIAILITFHAARSPVDRQWLALAAMWAACYGFRSIVWHQLADRSDDALVGLSTFAVRHERAAARLVELLIFPLEVLALGLILLRMNLAAPVIALLAYAIFVVLRIRMRGTGVYIVRDRKPAALAMQGYYDFAFPLSLLVTSALLHAGDLLLLVLHIVVFPRQFRRGITITQRLMAR